MQPICIQGDQYLTTRFANTKHPVLNLLTPCYYLVKEEPGLDLYSFHLDGSI